MKAFIAKAHAYKLCKKQKGQGVIEYAGALVIASVLVAAILAVGPDGISGLFENILTQVQTYFEGKVGEAGLS